MSLEVKHVFYTYQEGSPTESHALQDICLTVNEGEFLGIVGQIHPYSAFKRIVEAQQRGCTGRRIEYQSEGSKRKIERTAHEGGHCVSVS